jgi:hypothetical protein
MEEASQGGTGVISNINEVSGYVKSLKKADTPAEFVKHLNDIEECGGRASMLGLLSPRVDQAVTRALRFIRQNQNLFVFGDSSNKEDDLWLVYWEDVSEWNEEGWSVDDTPLAPEAAPDIAAAMIALISLASDHDSQGSARIFLEESNSIEDFLGKVYRAGVTIARVSDAEHASILVEHCLNDNGFTLLDFGEGTGGHFIGEMRVIHSSGDMYTMRVDKDL